ncbi:MAG: hypothetical protein ACFFD4_21340 [Candidatus Odinarchaeota archaeon]
MTEEKDEQDEQLESYRSALIEMQASLRNIVVHFSREEDYRSGITSLSANYEILANTLSTLLNWIRLQQEGLAALSSIHDWSQILLEEEDVSTIRYQLRTMIIGQIETMTQNFVSSDRSSKNILQFVVGQLDNIPRLINQTKSVNEAFLSILQYNAIYDTSLLLDAVNSLYQGNYKKFQEAIAAINKNVEQSSSQL